MSTPQQLPVDFASKSFLIIDDFHGMRSILRDILRSCGVNTRNIATAANGGEAIALLEKNRFDGVLCDFNLGAGKNGQQVLEEAKYRNLVGPGCAWIMITAEKTADVVMGAAEYQPDAYLIKPITEATLRLRLDKIWAKKEAFAEIDQAVLDQDFLRAAKLCDQRLATDRSNAGELLRLKCQMLLAAGDHGPARTLCNDILAQRDVPWAKLGLARAHFAAGELAEARALLEALVEEQRTFLEAYDWLVTVLKAQNDLTKAEEVLERAARLSPNSVTRQKTLGEVALHLGKLDNAEKAFRKSVALGEHSVLKTADAYLGLAKTCSALNNPNEALQVLGTLTKQFDGDEVKVQALAAEGLVHHRAGDPIAARKAAQRLGETLTSTGVRPDSASTLEMAELMLVTGEKQQAVALLQDAVRSSPEDTALLGRVQQVFDGASMGAEGSALVEASRKESVELMNQGVLLMRDGKFDEALAALRTACERLPGNIRVLLNFAHLALSIMQKTAVDPALADEVRARLATVHRLSPGEKRYVQLMRQVDTLTR
ncbi:tetratricopeptide repeat-containing response regulator [Oryzomicrobium sp.]|uniref:tetratricopeptide repeat-containing response regulator n=1 Tax=Oryzomicrobium sp. TaxID=1911578 RepID=UPI0025CC5B1B|nr:tetratricopeptide repeat-containing response regulator [Oryzomicrobium sp.]MCE1244158.1 tetratricopeptide repeat protein [Oryzomicrobium sp.]